MNDQLNWIAILLGGIWVFSMVNMFRLGDIRDELKAIRRQGNRR
jgi:hypothetical protein